MYFLLLNHSDAYHNTADLHFNPLVPGICGSNVKSVIPKHLSWIKFMNDWNCSLGNAKKKTPHIW